MSKKPTQPEPNLREIVADAMNEQGFLFQQLVREKIRHGDKSGKEEATHWSFIACEYPVTAANGLQTRIDVVLQNVPNSGVHICLECKRALPPFKRWVFFDQGVGIRGEPGSAMFLETLNIQRRPVREFHQGNRSLDKLSCPSGWRIYNYYLESTIKREGKSSATETIETALRQVVQGQTGLMAKLWGFDSGSFIRSIPVVVTTAEMFEARFDHERIDLRSGQLNASDLNLSPLEFCGVNYRPDDGLALRLEPPPTVVEGIGGDSSRFSINQIAVRGGRKADVHSDLTRWQMRTVFIVQAAAINRFLNWAHTHLTSPVTD